MLDTKVCLQHLKIITVNIYPFKDSNRNIRKRSKTCSKLTIKAQTTSRQIFPRMLSLTFLHISQLLLFVHLLVYTQICFLLIYFSVKVSNLRPKTKGLSPVPRYAQKWAFCSNQPGNGSAFVKWVELVERSYNWPPLSLLYCNLRMSSDS